MRIPIIEELPDGCYRVNFFEDYEQKKEFKINEWDNVVSRELNAYIKTREERRHNLYDFIREIKQEFTDEIISFKQNRIDYLEPFIKHAIDDYEFCINNEFPSMMLYFSKCMSGLESMLSEAKSLKGEIRNMQVKESLDEGKITQQDIISAKNKPFETLIELTNGKCLCPFHSESTPSFSVHKDKNYGHCFGCGKTVDTIQFIMETKRMNFIDAVKLLK